MVEKAKHERRQKIVEAEGEAASIQLIGKAIASNPGFLRMRKIDAAKEIAHTMANSANRVYLDANRLHTFIFNIIYSYWGMDIYLYCSSVHNWDNNIRFISLPT